jgi:asparagine synthase (glutamine-hydrolysing)
MCGISGIIFNSTNCIEADTCASVFRALKHRGPDDNGWIAYSSEKQLIQGKSPRRISNARFVFFHTRLSIIDLSEAGRQPMLTDDGALSITYNGEIYNYLELKNELKQEGYRFTTQTDTEVLLNVYRCWGIEGLKRCEGMFAFALFDKRKNKIILARDFFGIKPLYFSKTKDGILFSSEIGALLKYPGISKELNHQKIYDYLRFGLTDHGNKTILDRIQQLPPAHYLEINLNNPQIATPRRYWQIKQKKFEGSFKEAAETIRHIFLKNVERHLRTDVPFGAALSGGIDSSAIVMAVRHLEPDADINTFSYIAEGKKSEEKWIDIVNNAAKTKPHKIRKTRQDLVNNLEELIQIQGEPFGTTSIFAQYSVFHAAKEAGIKVMLDGQGADEIFAGYLELTGAQLATLFRSRHFCKAMKLLHYAGKLPGNSNSLVIYNAVDCLLPTCVQKPLRKLVGKNIAPKYLNIDWFKKHGTSIRSTKYTRKKNVLKTILRNSFNTGLPHLLRYEDRNAMSASIESRVPFLTPSLVEFVLSLPNEYLISNDGTTKAVLREALTPLVPKEILNRRDKIGFETPEKSWLTGLGAWANETLKTVTNDIPPLNIDQAKKQWESVLAGSESYTPEIWRWINFIRWCALNNAVFL